MLAYADLNSIFEAFLASEGKKIIPNPGEGNNCAIYALLQPLYPDLEIDELDKEVALLRAEYDELYPSDSTKRLHLDGSSGSSIDALIDIVNKRYDKNIRVQVVSAGFSPEYPCTEYGIFPKDEKILRPGRPSHDLIIYDQQGHYVAVVDRELVAHHDEPG
ncbi:hypothetical protein RO07_13460 [Pandoraea pulmonicola]|nr:hypothetical protein RO07_13460 [Pandoraea pulmonicola]